MARNPTRLVRISPLDRSWPVCRPATHAKGASGLAWKTIEKQYLPMLQHGATAPKGGANDGVRRTALPGADGLPLFPINCDIGASSALPASDELSEFLSVNSLVHRCFDHQSFRSALKRSKKSEIQSGPQRRVSSPSPAGVRCPCKK